MANPSERGDGSGALLSTLLDLVAGGVVLLDSEARIRRWNPGARSVLGWAPDDVLGRDVVELAITPAEQDAARANLARLLDPSAVYEDSADEDSADDDSADDDRADNDRASEGSATEDGRLWTGAVPLVRKTGGTVLCAVRARPVGVDGEVLVVFAEVGSRGFVEDERTTLLHAEQAARAELEHVRDRLAFVVHAGSRLASSLDVGMTLETVGDLVVPRFGRLCIIDLWDGRQLERVYVREAEPGRPDLIRDLLGLSGTQRDDHPAMRAVRTARPAILEATGADMVAQMYDSPEARKIVERAAGGEGFVVVPLITRGRVIGVLTLLGSGRGPSRPLPPGADLDVVEQVASRAAQSIENARLFDAERRLARSLADSERRQRQAALTLQRSLLPAWVHQPEELEVATRYLPGAEEAEVGGDWYDVIPLAPGRTALVIGDVMGRGLRAATLMGQVRTAVRAYARQDLGPKEVFDLLDSVVADLGESEIVTCVHAVFDAVRGSLTYASAGHLPLLLVTQDGRARRLDHETGLPLGVATCAAPEHEVEVPPGTLVAFYTDGLVEHRRRDIDVGIDSLVDTLAKASGTLEGLCDTVIDAMRPPEGYDDDVGLLLARARRTPHEDQTGGVSVAVPHDLSAAPYARSRVQQTLRGWNITGDLFDSIVLTAAELVSNALRHGAPPVQLQIRRAPGTVVVEVHDGTSRPPLPGDPTRDDIDGRRRGLQLVKMLSSRWGWRRTQRGKTVWCEHALP